MRRMLLLVVTILAATFSPGLAQAATQITITSPGAGAHSLSGVVPVTINASATAGIYSVQLKVDGVAVGSPVLSPTAPYTYVVNWDTTGVAVGNHTLLATAMDWSLPFPNGVLTDSAPVAVDVGPAYPTIQIDNPAPWSFARGTTQLTATATSSVAPFRVRFDVDGTPLTTSTTAPWVATWTTSSDGSHVVTATATDGRGKVATASVTVTVDNTRPLATITSPAQWTYVASSIAVTATASDTYGVASVQFLLDGIPTGAVRTQPDAGTQYTYSATIPVTGASNSQHRVAILALDVAGNSTTASPVYFFLSTPPPTAKVTAPLEGAFARGITPVTGTPTGGTAPYSLRLIVDGKATGQYVSASPYTLQWDTRPLPIGAHTLQMSVTDSQGRGSTSPAVHVTVDNVAPSVAVISPLAGTGYTTSLPASATASDTYGVATIQFALDGIRTGALLTASDPGVPYTYSTILSLTAVAAGTHAITVIATDPAGNTATSAPVYFTVGGTAPRATITLPPDWSFARGVTPVSVSIAGGTAPFTVRLVVDNKATTVTTSTSPYVLSWNTSTFADGTHTLQASVTDAAARGSTSPALHATVDNTPPTVVLLSPTASQRVSSATLPLQVHASDAFGVRSLQFAVDGVAAGPPLTVSDADAPYVYTLNYDTTALAPGAHTVGVTVIDNAGNTTAPAATSIKTGPLQYLPVLNYHEIAPPDGYDVYDQTPEEADAELAYLAANGYQSVTLAQYRQWLAGADIGIAKPVLITVDDGLKSELAWDALLQRYGFHAVLFVVTGYADGTTLGGQDPNNMSWADIQGLAATGRWEIALHAGQYGHGDTYGTGTRIGSQSYTTACPYFYSCLSGTLAGSTWTAESVSAFETAVMNEVAAARTELLARVPSATLAAWSAPFNDAGQWTNLYNDPSGQVQAWLPGYFAAQFPLVFTQTSPITYGQASGLVGSPTDFNRHYRFEVHTDTTIEQFAASLIDMAFAR